MVDVVLENILNLHKHHEKNDFKRPHLVFAPVFLTLVVIKLVFDLVEPRLKLAEGKNIFFLKKMIK